MDADTPLQEAKDTLRAAWEMYNDVANLGVTYDDVCWPPAQCIQYSQAAALIAIAEQLAETNKHLSTIAQAFDQDNQAVRVVTLR